MKRLAGLVFLCGLGLSAAHADEYLFIKHIPGFVPGATSGSAAALTGPESASVSISGGMSPGAWASITLQNGGAQETGAITASLTNTDDFELDASGCTTLSGGQSCALKVRLLASDNGSFSGEVRVFAAPGGSKTITLAGTAGGFTSTWCWGWNYYNQLGVNTGVESNPQPVRVSGMPGGEVRQIGLGYGHSCVLLSSGRAWCWGWNGNGQLGSGNNTNSVSPVEVVDVGKTFVDMSVYSSHACAIASDHSLWCWGNNGYGALGDGSTFSRKVPVAVSTMGSGVTRVSSGYDHTCAVKDGGAWCWGYNANGELGNNSQTNTNVPVQVQGLESGVEDVAAGFRSSCALKTDGSIWCWGFNGGWLGIATKNQVILVAEPLATPVSGVEKLYRGDGWFCGRKADGTMWCWGVNNNGQLGIGSTQAKDDPVLAQGGATALDWQTGRYHTCGLRADHTVWCAGYNTRGALGDGSLTNRTSPVQVQNLPEGTVLKIGTGSNHTCAVIR